MKHSEMALRSGNFFDVLEPNVADIHISDIAVSLSRQCRFAGHCDRFYSVAEHSVAVSMLLPLNLALTGLLHDASEAYLVDVPRPAKRCLDNYASIEHDIQRAVADRFGLPYPFPSEVHHADEVMLATEARDLNMARVDEWDLRARPLTVEAGKVLVVGWRPEIAEMHFRRRFHELTGERS